MAVIQPSGALTELGITNDPAVDFIEIYNSDSVNLITGKTGVTTIKVDIVDATGTTQLEGTSLDTTYEFVNPIYSYSGAGTGVEFTVIAAYYGYSVIITNPGQDFQENDQFTIDGADLGGASLLNDLVLTVLAVNGDGGVLGVTQAGAPQWPQSQTSYGVIQNATTNYIQVSDGTGTGMRITVTTGTGGTLFVQPVTVIG